MQVPFNKPYVDRRVLKYIEEVFTSGKLGGDGPMCKLVEEQLERHFNIRFALLTTSCSHALEMGMMLLGLISGDEVIVPSFTFVSTANAIIRGGGQPVFCEINAKTMTIDAADFERRITSRTKAVITVHYAGVAAEMDEIMSIAKRHNVVVVEDAAQGVNAKYKNKYLGSIGDAGAYSFHDTKNYVSGEGGAFVTNNETFMHRAEIIREKGTNRSNFLRGEVDKYTWVDHGSSYVLSDILAAVLRYQLDIIEEIQARRKQIHDLYIHGFADLEKKEKLRLPVIPAYCSSNYHIFYILLHDEGERDRVIQRLKELGIGSAFHYVPLHSSPYAQKVLGTQNVKLPVTDKIFSTLLRLPIYPHLQNSEVTYIVERVNEILQ